MFSFRDWVVILAAIALVASAFYVLLPLFIQPLLRAILWPRYRFRVRGTENVPRTGPAVVAANHTSWLDGFILAALTPRRGKAMVNAGYIDLPVFRELTIRAGIIPTPFTGPRAIRDAIRKSQAVLKHHQVLGIFPEGQISRIGIPGPFYRGLEAIVKGHDDAPVIPVAIDNLWGSIFSRSEGRFFLKRPRGWRRTINVVYGKPVPHPITAFAVRQALIETQVHAYALREPPITPLETLDPSLPRWEHPMLGLLTASTADLHLTNIHQIGNKPGTVGHPVPGVALRVVNDRGACLPAATEGRLEVLRASHLTWTDTGRRGSIDTDGFVTLTPEE